MSQIFDLAKAFIDLPPNAIEGLLDNPIHEVRVGAVSVMDKQRDAGCPQEGALRPVSAARRPDRLVGPSRSRRPHVVGRYLWDRPRKVLYRLTRS
jgi:hypothetical protein